MDYQEKLRYFRAVQQELNGDLKASALRVYAGSLMEDIRAIAVPLAEQNFAQKQTAAVAALQRALTQEINQAAISARANQSRKSHEKYLAQLSTFNQAVAAIQEPLGKIIAALEQLETKAPS